MLFKDKLTDAQQEERDQIIWGDWKPEKGSHPLAVMSNAKEAYKMGGTRHFGDGGAVVVADKIDLLLEKGFIDLEEASNERPSTKEFLVLLKECKGASAIGFAVSNTRWDTRVAIDGVQYLCNGEVPKEVTKAFKAFEKKYGAQEKHYSEGHIRLWWD